MGYSNLRKGGRFVVGVERRHETRLNIGSGNVFASNPGFVFSGAIEAVVCCLYTAQIPMWYSLEQGHYQGRSTPVIWILMKPDFSVCPCVQHSFCWDVITASPRLLNEASLDVHIIPPSSTQPVPFLHWRQFNIITHVQCPKKVYTWHHLKKIHLLLPYNPELNYIKSDLFHLYLHIVSHNFQVKNKFHKFHKIN